ncbi:putative cfem domain-containing protein [Diaporthe ampelina]|uniref:Putative cfem domain-containing protein n=1 Tax=Diaporthe ampelina TaxID=1214573 RepID=A0A0G2FFN1_9PEZI|nr:putative cfem domain-containing protein [Diaporthe ampelina]
MVARAASTGMPECAEKCLVEYLPSSACHVASNITCICTNAPLAAQMAKCVTAGCSVRDALLTKRFDATACDRPVTDDSLGLKVITPLFGVLAVLFFLCRVWARSLTGLAVSWQTDDWMTLVTTAFSVPLTVVSYLFAAHGLGRDLWMVDFDDITFVLEMYYYSEILYLVVIFMTKISICFFYLRVFPKKEFRVRVFTIIGLCALAATAFTAVTIFQCTPIPGAWLHWDGTYHAVCRDVQTQALWAAIVSIVLDVATIFLPMSELWALNMSLRKKLGVMTMFATGVFVVVVQVLRIVYLLEFSASTNFTSDYTATSIWSNVEVYVGIMCACFPQCRTLMTKFGPRVFGTTQGASTKGSALKPPGIRVTTKIQSQFSQRPTRDDETEFVELRGAAAGPDGFSSTANLHRAPEKHDGDGLGSKEPV